MHHFDLHKIIQLSPPFFNFLFFSQSEQKNQLSLSFIFKKKSTLHKRDQAKFGFFFGRSVEPGAATCHPDAHGLGRQEPDEVVREVFNLQDLQGSQFVGTGSARLSTGREDASGGLWSREPLHAITTGRSMLRPSYPPSGVVTTNVTPQGSGYDTGGTATPWLHLAMLEELLQATVEPSYPPGGVTGQRDPPGEEGK